MHATEMGSTTEESILSLSLRQDVKKSSTNVRSTGDVLPGKMTILNYVSQPNLLSPTVITHPTLSNSTFQKGDSKKRSNLKPKKDEAAAEVERKTNEAQSKSKKVSFQEEQNEQWQDDEDVDMEEPATIQDEVKNDPGKKLHQKKKTLASQKVEMVYVRKNQDVREERKAEDTKQDEGSYLYQDLEILDKQPPPVGIPIKE